MFNFLRNINQGNQEILLSPVKLAKTILKMKMASVGKDAADTHTC